MEYFLNFREILVVYIWEVFLFTRWKVDTRVIISPTNCCFFFSVAAVVTSLVLATKSYIKKINCNNTLKEDISIWIRTVHARIICSSLIYMPVHLIAALATIIVIYRFLTWYRGHLLRSVMDRICNDIRILSTIYLFIIICVRRQVMHMIPVVLLRCIFERKHISNVILGNLTWITVACLYI